VFAHAHAQVGASLDGDLDARAGGGRRVRVGTPREQVIVGRLGRGLGEGRVEGVVVDEGAAARLARERLQRLLRGALV
jgi:hypothetical protein